MVTRTLEKLNKQQHNYLSGQMKKVSRSFALVVAQLEEELQDQLATAYLICRVVDNIEDTTQPFEWQQQRFSEFEALLQAPGMAESILGTWDKENWPGLTADERKLMGQQDGQTLWDIYGLMSESVRQTIQKWSLAMAQGMRQIEDPHSSPLLVVHQGIQVLASEKDYNQYCYFVAGTVGHMATDLAIRYYDLDDETAALLEQTCEACGRGLQKTNIVKDFARDVSRGISYIPDAWLGDVGYGPLLLRGAPRDWKEQVMANVFAELREATQYVLALPYEAIGYRMASLLCLFPAYQTLLQAAERQQKLFTNKHKVKISRSTMLRCMHEAKAFISNNDGILAYSQQAEARFAELFSPVNRSVYVASSPEIDRQSRVI
jgi:farnesyl-diphosphate farnesyltransferase